MKIRWIWLLDAASRCPQCGCVIEEWEWRCIYCKRPRSARNIGQTLEY